MMGPSPRINSCMDINMCSAICGLDMIGASCGMSFPVIVHHQELPPKLPHTCDPREWTSVRGASRGSRMSRVQRHQLVRHNNSPLLVVYSGIAFALRMCFLDSNLVEKKTACGVQTTNMDTVLPMSRCQTAKTQVVGSSQGVITFTAPARP